MTVTTNLEGTELTVAPAGRIDTTTAPEVDAAVRANIENITKLVFDFKDLDYISSAGIRVLLSALKGMKGRGEMIVKNVSDDVMEVFDITGLNDILTIQ